MQEMSVLQIELGERSYPIFIGSSVLSRAGDLIMPCVRGRKAFIVTDSTVEKLYLKKLEENLKASGFSVLSLVVPASEMSKSFAEVENLLEKILSAGCDRHSFLVALGGGVIGDLTGFCASVLLRGVDFIQVPTTLLSQVDSSVGGKTAINTKAGKNLVGTFYQPKAVLIDIETLQTLDKRQLCAGYAEVAKYGLILDETFWEWLEENASRVLALEKEACRYAVEQSCRIKAAVVAADEHEENGKRALLNLGHTFGHALEAESGMDGTVLHGEGVAAGSVLAAQLSENLKMCPAGAAERIKKHFEKCGVTIDFPVFPVPALMSWMMKDKKTLDSCLNLVLLEKIGRAVLVKNVPEEKIKQVWKQGRTD